MSKTLYGADILSIRDMDVAQINLILDTAERLKKQPDKSKNLLQGKLIANCFFEASTRTRLSFEAAALRLGGQVIGFDSAEHTSAKKGETLSDSIKVIADYADLVVIRHPLEGSARLAAQVSSKPVINAGDGGNQHPTQTLIDLFTIREFQKKIAGLNVAVVGDLKYGRAVHSLVQACALFDVRLFLVAPEALALPEQICDELKKRGVRFSFHHSVDEVIPKVDILYATRIQQERFSGGFALENQYVVTTKNLANAKPNLKILHPLPRVNEIEVAVDDTPYAGYFAQAANGVCVRQALLTLVLNK